MYDLRLTDPSRMTPLAMMAVGESDFSLFPISREQEEGLRCLVIWYTIRYMHP
jgi:hypothetical protein